MNIINIFNIFNKFLFKVSFVDNFLKIFDVKFDIYKLRKKVVDLFNIKENKYIAV